MKTTNRLLEHFKPFVLVFVLTFGFASCDDNEPIQGIAGTVMDDAGNAYPNVQVTLQPNNDQATTNDQGKYDYAGLAPGSYEVSIKTPRACEVQNSNARSLDLMAGQSLTQNFTLNILPVDGNLVLDRTDPTGEVRNAQFGIPSDPGELIFRGHSSGLYPVLAPDGHQLTLEEWSTAEGISKVFCDGTTTHYELQLDGLIPNGVYTVWNITNPYKE